MANYDPSAVRAQLKTLLQTATEIANVYDYYNPNIAGYPAIVFDITNEDGTMLDDSNNQRIITFSIYIYVEVPVGGQVAAKNSLDTAAKSVINILEKKSNDTLSNTVDWVMPTIGRRQEVETTQGLVMLQELQLKCYVASTIL